MNKQMAPYTSAEIIQVQNIVYTIFKAKVLTVATS